MLNAELDVRSGGRDAFATEVLGVLVGVDRSLARATSDASRRWLPLRITHKYTSESALRHQNTTNFIS